MCSNKCESFSGRKVIKNLQHVIFHLKQNRFGRSAQRSTALMGGNYAAPPGTRRWAASPAEYRGRLKRETRFYGPIPRAGVSIYTRHREIKRRSHPQSTSRPRGRSGSASLCFILTPGFRFVMHSNERSSLRIRENLGRRRGEEEEGEGLGRSGNQTAIAIFISARYLRWFWSAPIFFPSPIECCGESESGGWTIATIIPRPHRLSNKYVSLVRM